MTRTASAGVSTPAAILSVAALAVAVAIAFAAAGNGAGAADPSGAPSAPVVTAAPSAPASPVATPEPSSPATPSPAPSQVIDGSEIPLDDANGNDIALGISDREGLLGDVVSGDAGDGMSVRWGTALVRNLDPNTLEVTWVSYPQEALITLVVKADGDGVLLRFGQDAP